jgi:hypothetical protein
MGARLTFYSRCPMLDSFERSEVGAGIWERKQGVNRASLRLIIMDRHLQASISATQDFQNLCL